MLIPYGSLLTKPRRDLQGTLKRWSKENILILTTYNLCIFLWLYILYMYLKTCWNHHPSPQLKQAARASLVIFHSHPTYTLPVSQPKPLEYPAHDHPLESPRNRPKQPKTSQCTKWRCTLVPKLLYGRKTCDLTELLIPLATHTLLYSRKWTRSPRKILNNPPVFHGGVTVLLPLQTQRLHCNLFHSFISDNW